VRKIFDSTAQIAIPVFTISAFLALSLKRPFLSLVLSMIAQPFWIYSAWKAYKNANQIGLFINTVVVAVIISFGIINYLLN
jgi:hypothetical protein